MVDPDNCLFVESQMIIFKGKSSTSFTNLTLIALFKFLKIETTHLKGAFFNAEKTMTQQTRWQLDDPELSSITRLVFTYFNYVNPELDCHLNESDLLSAVIEAYEVGQHEALMMIRDGVWAVMLSSSDIRQQLPNAARELAAKSLSNPDHLNAAAHNVSKALDQGQEDYACLYLERLSHFACSSLVRDPEVAGPDVVLLVEA